MLDSTGRPSRWVWENGCETVSYLEGEVGNYPLSERVRSQEALVSSARLLRSLHDAASGYEIRGDEVWALSPREPFETICHGDFASYNCVYDGATAVGVIDFDACHPAPRAWDVAYALYRFAPLTGASNPDNGAWSLDDQCRRARLFCDAYGLEGRGRAVMPELVVERLVGLVRFMRERAAAGDEKFRADLGAGHAGLYIEDAQYVLRNAEVIRAGLQ
jgi:aminoglycoside phosphotransferase (APT) family kinase protein